MCLEDEGQQGGMPPEVTVTDTYFPSLLLPLPPTLFIYLALPSFLKIVVGMCVCVHKCGCTGVLMFVYT